MAEQIDIISQNTQSTVIAEFERQDKGTAEMIYAVIDTNVFVAALLSRHSDSATVLVINVLLNRGICPFLCTQNKNKCGFLLFCPRLFVSLQRIKEKMNMALGEYVLISPDLTQLGEWVKGRVIEVEDNSFVGTVISAQTDDGNIFFGRAADFKGIA